jgi:hypothetical protein
MKFYKESDVQVLIDALKIQRGYNTGDFKVDIILETFYKITPVAVPGLDQKYKGLELTHDTSLFQRGQNYENRRIRKIMEDK